MQQRKHLSASGLYKIIKDSFEIGKGFEYRKKQKGISIVDSMLSGFAIFSLKYASLLQFNADNKDAVINHNLRNLYKIKQVPSDTYMLEELDEINPKGFINTFRDLFRVCQRGKVLKRFEWLDGHYILSVDGTGYFSSSKIHCKSCCIKKHQNGSTTYYHQMLAAVMVHPSEKVVLPFAPEPITKEDGNDKNDCERNAAKRLLPRIRKNHPHLKCIVVEDALAPNAPHLKMLRDNKFRYVIGIKPGANKWIFDWVQKHHQVSTYEYTDTIKGKQVILRYLNNIPLNKGSENIIVNYIECKEIDKAGKESFFTWITDIHVTDKNVKMLMKAGRSRWKIENETFNTLKNQGYQFEHNFGHGENNLSTVFANLMMLAFFVDQILQTSSKQFKAALALLRNNKKSLWRRLRSMVENIIFAALDKLWEILSGERERPLVYDTS